MTKKEKFAVLKDIVSAATSEIPWLDENLEKEMKDFIDHEIEILSKKRSSVNSKAKAETKARAEKVYNALAEMTEPVTVTNLIKLTSDEEVAEYSVSRVTALLAALGDRVVNEKVKGKSYYSIA